MSELSDRIPTYHGFIYDRTGRVFLRGRRVGYFTLHSYKKVDERWVFSYDRSGPAIHKAATLDGLVAYVAKTRNLKVEGYTTR